MAVGAMNPSMKTRGRMTASEAGFTIAESYHQYVLSGGRPNQAPWEYFSIMARGNAAVEKAARAAYKKMAAAWGQNPRKKSKEAGWTGPKRYPTRKSPSEPTYSAQWSGVTGGPKARGLSCHKCGGTVHREGHDSLYCPSCDDYVRGVHKNPLLEWERKAIAAKSGRSSAKARQYASIDDGNVRGSPVYALGMSRGEAAAYRDVADTYARSRRQTVPSRIRSTDYKGFSSEVELTGERRMPSRRGGGGKTRRVPVIANPLTQDEQSELTGRAGKLWKRSVDEKSPYLKGGSDAMRAVASDYGGKNMLPHRTFSKNRASKYTERVVSIDKAPRIEGAERAIDAHQKFHGCAPTRVRIFEYDDGVDEVIEHTCFRLGTEEIVIDAVPGKNGEMIPLAEPLQIGTVYKAPTASNKEGAQYIHSFREDGGKPPISVVDVETGVKSTLGGTYDIVGREWIHH